MHSNSDSNRGHEVARRWTARGVLSIGIVAIAAYLALAYGAMPAIFRVRSALDPRLIDVKTVTHTADGHPGDPINLEIVATEPDMVNAMVAARWSPADPITLETSMRIAASVVFRRPDPNAPVSSLYYFGRKEDLAFEQEDGHDAKQRHHVRFWKSTSVNTSGMPIWFGSVTFDRSVGLSHATGQVTHHIAPDVDTSRDLLLADLTATGRVAETRWIDGFQSPPAGRNGGDDPWHTDGRLVVISLQAAKVSARPQREERGALEKNVISRGSSRN